VNNKDLILNTDPGDSIQGHVGPKTPQRFTTLQATPFSHAGLKLAGYEFLLRDQFGNHYHKMRAVLFDGEMYDVDQFIKPSMMMGTGGGHADLEDGTAKRKLRITEELLVKLRDNAAVTFGRTNIELMKARALSTSPVAIETQDITHPANVLEDAIVAAKLAAGEPLHKEPIEPPEFTPKSVKVDSNVIPFPAPTKPPLTVEPVTLDTKL
jgi:hypothetical protein